MDTMTTQGTKVTQVSMTVYGLPARGETGFRRDLAAVGVNFWIPYRPRLGSRFLVKVQVPTTVDPAEVRMGLEGIAASNGAKGWRSEVEVTRDWNGL
jgi:hypothetical protein